MSEISGVSASAALAADVPAVYAMRMEKKELSLEEQMAARMLEMLPHPPAVPRGDFLDTSV